MGEVGVRWWAGARQLAGPTLREQLFDNLAAFDEL
jgi:hypothetical protein